MFPFFSLFLIKNLYLLRSIQNVNETAANFFFFLQLQSGIHLTEQQLSSYKLHQRQLKMKKIKPKEKKNQLSLYITNLCCTPTRTCFKFPCQFTTPRLYQARLVAIENTTRTGLSKDTFCSVLTIQKKTLYSLKTNLTQPYISIFFFKRSELCTGGLNAL
jgi:hypothetical protein